MPHIINCPATYFYFFLKIPLFRNEPNYGTAETSANMPPKTKFKLISYHLVIIYECNNGLKKLQLLLQMNTYLQLQVILKWTEIYEPNENKTRNITCKIAQQNLLPTETISIHTDITNRAFA